MLSPVRAAPLRIQQLKIMAERKLFNNTVHTALYEPARTIPEVDYVRPWTFPYGTIAQPGPNEKQYAIVMHTFDSGFGRFVSVRCGEILEVLAKENEDLKVRRCINGKTYQEGYLFAGRVMLMNGEPYCTFLLLRY